MADFDPDAYIKSKSAGFDPDAYIKSKDPRAAEVPAPTSLKYTGEKPMDDPNFASGMKPMMRAISSSFTNAGRDVPGEVQRMIGGMGPGAAGALEAAAIAKGLQMVPRWSGALSEAPAAVRGFENYVRPAAQALTPDSLKGLAGLAGLGAMSGAGGVAGRDVAAGMNAGPAGQQVGELAGMFIGPAPLGIPKAIEATGQAMGRGARGMMRSALKPTHEANKAGKGGKAVETMLEEGLNVTEGGEKILRGTQWMRGRIRDLNDRVLQHAENSGAQVDWTKIRDKMEATTNEWMEQHNSIDDLKILEKQKKKFIKSMQKLTEADFIPVAQAQRIKQKLYKKIGDAGYGKNKGKLKVETKRDIWRDAARAWREEIDQILPEAVPLNAEESRLLNALSVSERRVMMDANKNPAGLGVLSLNKERFAAWTADRSPLFKSLIARMLYKGEQLATEKGRAAAWLKRQPQGPMPLELAPQKGNIPTLDRPPRSGPAPLAPSDWISQPGASVPTTTAQRPRSASIATPERWTTSEIDRPPFITRSGDIPLGTSASQLQIPGIPFKRPIADELGYVAMTEKEQAALRDPATMLARKNMLEQLQAANKNGDKKEVERLVQQLFFDWSPTGK